MKFFRQRPCENVDSMNDHALFVYDKLKNEYYDGNIFYMTCEVNEFGGSTFNFEIRPLLFNQHLNINLFELLEHIEEINIGTTKFNDLSFLIKTL